MSFELDIRAFVERTRISTRTAVRKLVLDTFLEILKRSPVDTGRFRANWRVALGAPDLRTTSVAEGGTTSRVGQTLSEGERQVAAVFSTSSGVPEEIWISNNVPYAEGLERGSSSQASSGVVRPSIDAVLASFRSGL